MHHRDTLGHRIATLAEGADDRGIIFVDDDGSSRELSHPQIFGRARAVAAELQRRGVEPGEVVLLLTLAPRDGALLFAGAVLAGAVPLFLAPPMNAAGLEPWFRHAAAVVARTGARTLLCADLFEGLAEAIPTPSRVLASELLRAPDAAPRTPGTRPDDTAYLQLTSGSTGDPRCIEVSHAAVLANVDSFRRSLDHDPTRDFGVSWLPLYHDMGLVGFVLTGLTTRARGVLASPLEFLRRPAMWFDLLHQHRGTITFAPPFAYDLMARRATPAELERWDLSCVRVFGCGAEPIPTALPARFTERFGASCGVRPDAFTPAYGLAEACLAVSFKPQGEPWRAREQVCCGRALPDHELRILDPAGASVGPGIEGEIVVRGPSLARGYLGDPEGSAERFRDGWLHTGDLGYLDAEGQLYVTGRLKDLIIVRGRNIHPQVLEQSVTAVPGVRPGRAVAFAVDAADGEAVVVLAETHEAEAAPLAEAIHARLRRDHGVAPAEVRCLPPDTLPRTSSGKLRRSEARRLYLEQAWS